MSRICKFPFAFGEYCVDADASTPDVGILVGGETGFARLYDIRSGKLMETIPHGDGKLILFLYTSTLVIRLSSDTTLVQAVAVIFFIFSPPPPRFI